MAKDSVGLRALAPDGSKTADTLKCASGGPAWMESRSLITARGPQTFSIFARRQGRQCEMSIGLSNGERSADKSFLSPDNWERFDVTLDDVEGSVTSYVRLHKANGAARAGDSALLWCPQLEDGRFPSSPMPPQPTPTKTADPSNTLEWIRTQVVAAMASDDDLGELLVLKGGNALRLVHQIGTRASLDLDYSIAGTLDAKSILQTIERALRTHFSRVDYVAFDVKIEKKPRIPPEKDKHPEWGGWRVTFKLITTAKHELLKGDPAKISMQALELYEGKKAFRIDVSSYEYVEDAVEISFEGYPVRVYTLPMIVYEKLRALCQQMDDYKPVTNPTPRPRDFVDICSILDDHEEDVFAERALLAKVFGAKSVPSCFLHRLAAERAFHEKGWSAVAAELGGDGAGFDTYLRRVLSFVKRLDSAGVIDAPA